MLAQVHEELDIPRTSPLRRETTGIGSGHARLIKPQKHSFCHVSATVLWIESWIKDTCPLVLCSPSHCSL